MTLEELIKTSNSLDILRNVNKTFNDRKFHEFTHILYDVRTILGEYKKTYLEIGSYVGSSASLMLQHQYPTKIICIDPLVLSPKHFNGSKSQELTLKENIKKNNIYSYEVDINKNYSTDENVIIKLKNEKIDILFIDGDHRYKGVIADWNNYKDLVVSGGYIIFDDYLDWKHSPDVKKAVDDIVKDLDKSKYKIIGSLPNYQNALAVIPIKNSNEFIIKVL